jgi:16S rRNA (guanine(966)-N(2))-methyltransferase RsmD
MRIITGKFRGRKIHPPHDLPVRPTTDFAKESLFDILNNLVDFTELEVLDLFAGTGNISYEFISRGCKEIVAVEINTKCHSFIRKTAEELIPDFMTAIRTDVFTYLKHPEGAFDLVFADPPYDMEGIDTLPGLIINTNLLREEGWFILEHSHRFDFSKYQGFNQQRKYGNVNFSFFRQE